MTEHELLWLYTVINIGPKDMKNPAKDSSLGMNKKLLIAIDSCKFSLYLFKLASYLQGIKKCPSDSLH